MKKLSILFILLILPLAFLSADIRFQNPESGYEKNMATVFYKPNVGYSWGSGYDNDNFLGLVGVSNHAHPMRFTISSNCRFVSASDPTKYREVSIYFLSRYTSDTTMGGTHYAFDREVLLTTVNNVLTTVSGSTYGNSLDYPSITGKNKAGIDQTITLYSTVCDASKSYNDGNRNSVVGGFWYDVVLVQDALTTEEQKHMSATDDYVLEISIDYECLSNCSDHHGSLILSYRGYYDVDNPQSTYASFIVIPNAASGSLNIGDPVNRGSEINPIEVGTFSFTSYFVYKTPTDPSTLFSRFKIFVSSSPSYNDSGASEFRMKKIGVLSADTIYNSVPLVVVTKDALTGSKVSYDGTDYYSINGDRRTNNNNAGTYETLAFPSPTEGNKGYMLRQDAIISVYVPPTDTLSETTTMTTWNENTRTALLAGAYQEDIYFHLVVE